MHATNWKKWWHECAAVTSCKLQLSLQITLTYIFALKRENAFLLHQQIKMMIDTNELNRVNESCTKLRFGTTKAAFENKLFRRWVSWLILGFSLVFLTFRVTVLNVLFVMKRVGICYICHDIRINRQWLHVVLSYLEKIFRVCFLFQQFMLSHSSCGSYFTSNFVIYIPRIHITSADNTNKFILVRYLYVRMRLKNIMGFQSNCRCLVI